uniref:Uncharacterized protein n=1 Tax=Sipha flava TaxID=143950 RepID=A0A2S2QEB4_9HEMI
MSRLGNIGIKSRSLKLILKNKSDIGLVLKSKSKLCEIPSMRNFHINLDWIPYQRKLYKSVNNNARIGWGGGTRADGVRFNFSIDFSVPFHLIKRGTLKTSPPKDVYF